MTTTFPGLIPEKNNFLKKIPRFLKDPDFPQRVLKFAIKGQTPKKWERRK